MSDGLEHSLLDQSALMNQHDSTAGQEARKPLPKWKKRLLFVAVALVLIGVGIEAYASISSAEQSFEGTVQGARDSQSHLRDSLTGADATDPRVRMGLTEEDVAVPAENPLDAWSPLFYRLGIGFVIGFAIGMALRTFLKFSLVAIGLVALAMLGLSKAGVVDVDWETIQTWFESFRTDASAQVGDFKDFMLSELPGAGSALLGLLIGFKK